MELPSLKIWFKRKDLLIGLWVGIVLKGLDGVLGVVGGLPLLVLTPATIDHMTISLTQHELSQDPHDFIATHLLLHATSGLTGSAVQFAAAYLLSHGVVKIVLIAALLREQNPPQCQRPRRNARPRPGFGRVARGGQPPHIDLRQAILRASGADSDQGEGGRGCLEVPPTGYTATANSNLNPGPHGPEPYRRRVLRLSRQLRKGPADLKYGGTCVLA